MGQCLRELRGREAFVSERVGESFSAVSEGGADDFDEEGFIR